MPSLRCNPINHDNTIKKPIAYVYPTVETGRGICRVLFFAYFGLGKRKKLLYN